jgi:hypothetical protein
MQPARALTEAEDCDDDADGLREACLAIEVGLAWRRRGKQPGGRLTRTGPSKATHPASCTGGRRTEPRRRRRRAMAARVCLRATHRAGACVPVYIVPLTDVQTAHRLPLRGREGAHACDHGPTHSHCSEQHTLEPVEPPRPSRNARTVQYSLFCPPTGCMQAEPAIQRVMRACQRRRREWRRAGRTCSHLRIGASCRTGGGYWAGPKARTASWGPSRGRPQGRWTNSCRTRLGRCGKYRQGRSVWFRPTVGKACSTQWGPLLRKQA